MKVIMMNLNRLFSILCLSATFAATISFEAYGMKHKADEPEEQQSAKRQKTEQEKPTETETKVALLPRKNTKNIVFMLQDREHGNKLSRQKYHDWLKNFPDRVAELILDAPEHVTNFIELYRMLPAGIDAGTPRCLVLDELDKKAQEYYDKYIKDKKALEKRGPIEKLPAGYFKMKVRALYTRYSGFNKKVD